MTTNLTISKNAPSVVTPRLGTLPLRELTPETSYGYDVIRFARRIGMPLDPWQEEAVIRGGELLPDGRPRFRKILIIVARQNGKTHLIKILILYWLFVERYGSVLGISTLRDYAKGVLVEVSDIASDRPYLGKHMIGYWSDNNDTRIEVRGREGRIYYRIAAMGRKAGRGKTYRRIFLDELREHVDFETVKAALPTMSAVFDGQAWIATNQGDATSVVLKSYREAGLSGTDDELCLLEWSAPPGSAPDDPDALRAANPNVGIRLSLDSLLNDARAAMADSDPQVLTGFRTEIMCQYVPAMDPAIDPQAWEGAYVPGDLEGIRDRVLCADISPDMQHATIVAGALLPDDRVRLVVVEAYHGADAVAQLRRGLYVWTRKILPRKLVWFPNGPAATVTADLRERKDRGRPFPSSVALEEISGEVAAACMGFSSRVAAGQVIHGNEALLNAHVTGAAKRWNGDVWRFERKGEGHCDAAYAAAGADHAARTLPRALGKPRIIVAS